MRNIISRISDNELISAFKKSKSINDLGKKLGYKYRPGQASRHLLYSRLKKLNINDDSLKVIFSTNTIENKEKLTKCKNCGSKLKQSQSGFCRSCLNEIKAKEKIDKWLDSGKLNLSIASPPRGCIRNYILKDQNCKCAICGLSEIWNGQELHFILDHIDGDAGNNERSNLRLVCPNCDSQLPTFKSRNKNSARSNKRHN